MLTLEKELTERNLDETDYSNMSQREVLIALGNLLTKEEGDELEKAMKNIERRKLKLYDDLRA